MKLFSSILRFLITLFVNLALVFFCFAKDEHLDSLLPPVPHHVLVLNLNEFSILNVSYMDGLLKYGGSGELQLKMAKVENEVIWTVTVDGARLMELLGIFVGERTMKLVQDIDPTNLAPNQQIALSAIKSLSKKLEQAQKNPVWDLVKLTGMVVQQGTNWALEARQGTLTLAGARLEELKARKGRPIVAEGYVKQPGLYEVASFQDQRTNTAELFVMSYCPYGQRAETLLLDFADKASPKPFVELHYLFYKQKKDGKEVFTSLHGEEEIVENLVQMVVREKFPAMMSKYVRMRATSGKLPWPQLAELAGLTKANIAEIEQQIATQREALIQREYDYMTSHYGSIDSSPSYVWESERVPDLRKVERFKGLDGASGEACKN